MKELYRFIKFSIVGVSNTLLTLLIYMLLLNFGVYFVTANIIGYAVGVCNSYFWNSKYVFERTDTRYNTIPKFIVVNLIILGVTTILLYLFAEKLGMGKYLSQAIVIPTGMAFNYGLNKVWTFKRNIKC
jgi:putative flippase GtrA